MICYPRIIFLHGHEHETSGNGCMDGMAFFTESGMEVEWHVYNRSPPSAFSPCTVLFFLNGTRLV
jgi:hypothetical protein